MSDWHVVQVNMRKMLVALEALKKRGHETYVPRLRVLRPVPLRKITLQDRKRNRRPVEPRIETLFGGYVFVRMSLESAYHELFGFYGVYGLAVEDGRPGRIDGAVIERLRAEEVNGAIPAEIRLPDLLYRLGMVLRICDGPLKDFSGTIAELDESRCRVLLNVLMFGRETPVELSFDQVELVEQRSPRASFS